MDKFIKNLSWLKKILRTKINIYYFKNEYIFELVKKDLRTFVQMFLQVVFSSFRSSLLKMGVLL